METIDFSGAAIVDGPTSLRLLSISDVCKRTTLSRGTIYKMVKDKTFPPSIPVRAGRVAWIEAEIDAWILAKISAARASTG